MAAMSHFRPFSLPQFPFYDPHNALSGENERFLANILRAARTDQFTRWRLRKIIFNRSFRSALTGDGSQRRV
jgi:hypothetical protein